MNAIDELRYMNLQDIYEKMRLSNQEFDDWLESMGLLHTFQVCDLGGDHDGLSHTWICYKRDCLRTAGGKKPQKGLLVGTFFEESRISHKDVFLLSYFWAQQVGTMEKVEFEMKITHVSIESHASVYTLFVPPVVEINLICFSRM